MLEGRGIVRERRTSECSGLLVQLGVLEAKPVFSRRSRYY